MTDAHVHSAGVRAQVEERVRARARRRQEKAVRHATAKLGVSATVVIDVFYDHGRGGLAGPVVDAGGVLLVWEATAVFRYWKLLFADTRPPSARELVDSLRSGDPVPEDRPVLGRSGDVFTAEDFARAVAGHGDTSDDLAGVLALFLERHPDARI